MEGLLNRMATNTNLKSEIDGGGSSLENSTRNTSEIQQFKSLCDDPTKMTPYVMKYSNWKWVVLFLGSMVTFGDWYCLDNVAVLE